jgi:tripartite-type tricarboxylate transporter receptor subunit TctC
MGPGEKRLSSSINMNEKIKSDKTEVSAMKLGKKQMVILAIVLWACLVVPNDYAWTADYPARPINFQIPYGAGGATDLACRALADGASKTLGQPFVPINKGGAGGTIAAMSVMTAKPDGYTIGGTSTSNLSVAPFAVDNPYKDLKGFTQIMNFGNYVWAVMVRDDAPWKTWEEFIEWARKNPGAAKIGITGSRSNTIRGLCFWLIERKENVKFTYIPLKGTADLMTTLLGGHTNVSGSAADTVTVPYLKMGKIRILLFMSATKLPGTENVPTLEELYGFNVPNVMGIFAPKGIPEPIMQKLDDAFATAVKDPGFVKVMNQMHFPIVYMNRTEMTKYVDSTTQKTGDLIKRLTEEDAKDAKAAAVKK